MKLASEMGVAIASPWVTWVKASIVPALAGLLLTPLLMYKLFAPEIKDTPEAPKVRGCGPLSKVAAHALAGWPAGRLPRGCFAEVKGIPEVHTAGLLLGGWRPPGRRGAHELCLGPLHASSPSRVPPTAPSPPAQLAAERLEKMGPMSRDEKIMLGTMGAAVCL